MIYIYIYIYIYIHTLIKAAQTPLIERYGIKGYTKVPVDFEDAAE